MGTDDTSRRAFNSLKACLPTWQQVLDAEPEVVEEAIRVGGLAEIKTVRIKKILQTLLDEDKRGPDGGPSMEYLRDMSNDEVKTELGRFNGVGPKTISCVLMFCLDRA